MKAIILAAGQGRRLLPWTQDRAKCLLPFAGQSLIGWQLAALAANNVEEAVVVTGFADREVEREIDRVAPAGMKVSALFNPFFSVADNIASCWVAREHLAGEVAVINGDTLFEPAILARLRTEARYPITVTTDVKDRYDIDDMKVQIVDGKVAHIGKTLPPDSTDAESIGMLLLRGLGGPLFTTAVESVIHQSGGLSRWYLSAVDDLAARDVVGTVCIAGLEWTEVDYPGDLGRAEKLARGWSQQQAPQAGTPLAQ